ncbi:MAG: leucine--tRNA ligase [Pseudonocardiaceae bacterium]
MTFDAGTATVVDQYRYTAELAVHIELKWQRRWAERGTFNVPNPVGELSDGVERSRASKFYVIDMFPYPSGAGLHVGHPLGFIASDVYARFMHMKGHLVLHPFGFDAFGLPAEQYAIDTGRHPAETTRQNINNMRRQLKRLGLAHDPHREISTADPAYYRWTQWIFLKIFNSWCDPTTGTARPIEDLVMEFDAGIREPLSPSNPQSLAWRDLDDVTRCRVVDSYRLAYLEEASVNWCPGLGTVLANEEVTIGGRSEIGNYPVYRRRMRQWMLRITAFADRLLEDLEPLDWTDSLKTMQRNWIGRSEGADIYFRARDRHSEECRIQVYTTRPDTLFGVTFMALAPEHPLVDVLTADEWPPDTPHGWRRAALVGDAGEETPDSPRAAVDDYLRRMTSLSDRQRQAQTSKSAVFLGTYAVNPVSGSRIPIFIADYVLPSYGSGAVMAVPAHDQRDYKLATALGLPVLPVIRPDDQWLLDHAGASAGDPASWGEAFEDDGTLVNSSGTDVSLDGLRTAEAKETVIRWLESSDRGRQRTSYKLRDWLFSRQRYWGEPFPIVFDDTGLPVALPESMLPVELPPMTDFRPQATEEDEPRRPLSRAPGFEKVDLDLGYGLRTYRRETNTMPQWAGSCWYYLRYLDPTNDRQFVDPAIEGFWMGSPDGGERIGGVDLYIGGVEHGVLHLLYARFWHKILYDLGHVSTKEPFQRLYNQGYILADAFTDSAGRYVPAAEVEETAEGPVHRGEPVRRHFGKMGKSLKNSVSPDDIYDSYGADTLRMYEMAMGPLDVDRPWQPDDIVGVYRFLQRLWRNIVDEQSGKSQVSDAPLATTEPLYRLLHNTVDEVNRLFSDLRFNVAIARLMELNNALVQHVKEKATGPREVAEVLVRMTFPLAPHVASELWEKLGHTDPIEDTSFPVADAEALVRAQVVIPVTVDDKPRGEITVDREASEPEVIEMALRLDAVTRVLEGRQVARTIYVPGRILNLVTTRAS